MSETWTIERVLAWASDDLKSRGFESGRLEVELMLCLVLACDRIKLIINSKQPLSPEELASYKQLHRRRRGGEPIAYLRGVREFFSRSFHVDSRVLVPRPETELLVEVGLRRTHQLDLCARVLDLCTGSGCVAITLKKERPTTRVMASDISADAIDAARDNALRLGARVAFMVADLFEQPRLQGLRGKLDLITANPPYINAEDAAVLPQDVRDFEPSLALLSGVDGLDLSRRIVQSAGQMLRPGGVVALEVAHDSAGKVKQLLAEHGFDEVGVDKDYAGIERVVSARWRP
jgi:release factor glutamine methyltransferase